MWEAKFDAHHFQGWKYNSKSQVISFALFYITPEHGTFSQIFDMLWINNKEAFFLNFQKY